MTSNESNKHSTLVLWKVVAQREVTSLNYCSFIDLATKERSNSVDQWSFKKNAIADWYLPVAPRMADKWQVGDTVVSVTDYKVWNAILATVLQSMNNVGMTADGF